MNSNLLNTHSMTANVITTLVAASVNDDGLDDSSGNTSRGLPRRDATAETWSALSNF